MLFHGWFSPYIIVSDPNPKSKVKPEVFHIYIYPNDLKAKPTLWLWALRDVAIIGVCLVLSVLALVELGLLPPLICTVLYAFLSIRLEGASILDFLRYAMCFLFLKQQYYEWRAPES